MKIEFDSGRDEPRLSFTDPLQIIRAKTPDDVIPSLAALSQAQAEGHWLAGYFSYELGYCLTPKLASLLPASRDVPLILMGVFDRKTLHPAPPPPAAHPVLALNKQPIAIDRYRCAFDRIMDYLRAGDVYQVNFTFPLDLRCNGAPGDLFEALAEAQAVSHGAYVDLGGPILLSRSPELFFSVDDQGRIETRPMKGTAARERDADADTAARENLAHSEKNRAENLMIVDLLRNDLSRVCEVGSVNVPRLFDIETYATVHQMTSTIRGKLCPGHRLPHILQALFPCGSVTGAPKIRAMEIIRELEMSPRGAYCGAIGWVAPSGAMRFNVAIRTLTWHAADRITLNVGGGLVYDSTADAEYAEALWKGRFALGLLLPEQQGSRLTTSR